MKRLICRVFGHKWNRYGCFCYSFEGHAAWQVCERCGAHGNYVSNFGIWMEEL